MINHTTQIIELKDKYLFIVTDIHGNLDDFKYYLNLWLEDTSNHICFCGDIIYADRIDGDLSLEILDIVKKYIDNPNFHVLLGNHELAQILSDEVYRYHVNQTESFKKLVHVKFPNDYTLKYREYKKLLQKFDYFITTTTGLFIAHSGIHEDYLEKIINDEVDVLSECLWSRPYDDYSEKTTENFLRYINCKFMISGHTNYNVFHIWKIADIRQQPQYRL